MTGPEVVVLFAMLVGLIGVIVPILPGLLLILGAGVVWAVLGDGGPSWVIVAVMGVLAVLGTVAPYRLTGRRTTDAGAPRWVLLAGAAGIVVGFFVIPVVGALVGGPAAIFVAELVRQRRLSVAWGSTAEALKGLGVGIVIQFVAGVGMIATWIGGVIWT